jgi:YgiT-type zinc finger domain-containing protein
MRDWRAQHPLATLSEIEGELDTRLAGMRARLLENLALQSRATAWSQQEATRAEPPRCPTCGEALRPRGRATRHLKTQGGQVLNLPRTYGVCPHCGQGRFPPG